VIASTCTGDFTITTIIIDETWVIAPPIVIGRRSPAVGLTGGVGIVAVET
jgi:hypothetical protein